MAYIITNKRKKLIIVAYLLKYIYIYYNLCINALIELKIEGIAEIIPKNKNNSNWILKVKQVILLLNFVLPSYPHNINKLISLHYPYWTKYKLTSFYFNHTFLYPLFKLKILWNRFIHCLGIKLNES